jgi:predicted Holliday junction resolvase-like endonuclease
MPRQTTIEQLESVRGLKFECPNQQCKQIIAIKRAKLFDMRHEYPLSAVRIMKDRLQAANETEIETAARREKLKLDKIQRPLRHERGAHSSNLGKQSEHIVPAFVTFPYRLDECRTVLQPIDYIVFKGLSDHGRIHALQFIEVKTGDGVLSSTERCVQAAVSKGAITHRVVQK